MLDRNHGGSYILFRLNGNMLLPKGEILEEKSRENHTEQGWIQDALMIELNLTGMDLRKIWNQMRFLNWNNLIFKCLGESQ